MARPSNILISTIRRNQRYRGPSPSAQQNDFQDEVIRDISVIQSQHNNFIVPMTSTLPDGTNDLNAFANGLDGKTIYTESGATNSAALAKYYNSTKGRPKSIFEQFEDMYSYVDGAIEALETTVAVSTSSSGLTTAQKERIGLNVFDTGLTSSATSLDGKTAKNELNILQLAKDMYGSSYVSFTGTGDPILPNSVRAMVDALLELHQGDWSSDITLAHSISASEITSGTFQQDRVGPSSGAPAGVNDSYSGTPATVTDDLNILRTQLKNLKGTATFNTTITLDGSWGAVAVPPSNYVNLTNLGGSGSRSNTNPWGYDYTDIDGLNARLTANQAYTGSADLLDVDPAYSFVYNFVQGDSLTTAIGGLAEEMLLVSGHFGDTNNPHSVTLTQAATAGGSAPATQVSIVDAGAYYTGVDVEAALQEAGGDLVSLDGRVTALETGGSLYGSLSLNTSATLDPGSTVVLVDASSGDVVVDLPSALTASGVSYLIKRTDSSANAVTVSGLDLIDGNLTLPIDRQWNNISITSNGSSYYTERNYSFDGSVYFDHATSTNPSVTIQRDSGTGDLITGLSPAGSSIFRVEDNGALTISGSFTAPIETVTDDTLDETNLYLVVDTDASPRTLNLPAVAGAAGRVYHIRNNGTNTNNVTIDPDGSELINGAATFSLSDGQTAHVVCNGIEWFTF